MKLAWHTCTQIVILANALYLGCIDEVCGANGLAHDVIVVVACGQLQPLLHGNILQLCADLTNFTQRFYLQEVLATPLCTEVVLTPLFVYI